MLEQYGFVGILLIVAIAFSCIMVGLSFLFQPLGLRPRNPNPVKAQTYECGMEPVGGSWVQFNFRYYYFALMFVVFDVETVFLYPWAVAFKKLELFGLVEMVIFILILVVAFIYAWRKRALEWT